MIGDETTCRVIDENFASKKKKATTYLAGELSKTRYNSSTGGKKEKKNNVNKLCKDDERTAKEEKNTILTAYIISP